MTERAKRTLGTKRKNAAAILLACKGRVISGPRLTFGANLKASLMVNLRIVTLVVTFVSITAAACLAAENPQIGCWKFDPVHSHIPIGIERNQTVTYSQQGDQIKATFKEYDGKAKDKVWIGKFDGKPYRVTGTSFYDTTSYRLLDDRTALIKAFYKGKLAWWGKITVSDDGNTRTALLYSTDSDGKKVVTTKVYHRA